MTKLSTLFFFLAIASTGAFGTPVPENDSTEVSSNGLNLELDPVDIADLNEDVNVDVDDLDLDDNDHIHINALSSREVCNVGPVNMNVVDTVFKVARSRHVTSKVLLATFETGLQESNFNNLNCGDQDSVGVFQQRPSQGWGTVKQIRDVKYATNKFLDVAIPHDKANPGFTAGQLAQSVQISEFPDRYDKRKAAAEALIKKARARAGKPKPKPKPSKPVKAPKNVAAGTIKKGCKKYHTVKKGDTCGPLAKSGGISTGTFLKINKGVHSNCNNLQIGKAYCVKN
ncbi:hypothetical protein EXIGLDRAFT_793489 [Exidia glandulosa HHB12029]|uniref:LysM domain-containing protein n=1 Tax=Exidia glandulosa HHB12029 TaxID=1314781 RepID=A0A165NM28_EXIGL|nr:hypothetical protein EXIGLDRAFT_793489 [Exidia glandulosa HHB12029]